MNDALDIEKTDESLSDNDLIEAIEGRNPQIPRQIALKQFAKRISPRRREVYQLIIEDPSQPHEMRKAAAINLGKEYSAGNLEILLKNLKIRDDYVLTGIAHALGQIGDEKALEQLEALKIKPGTLAYENIQVAKHLISYRLRLNKYLYQKPPFQDILIVDRAQAVEFTAKVADSSLINSIIEQVKPQLPAVPLTEKGALQVLCRADEFLLVFNRNFQSGGEFASLYTDNALPMVYIKRVKSLGQYHLANYFFTHPGSKKGELILTGISPGGTLFYSGSVKLSGDEYSFSVRAVKSRYTAALELEGSYNIKTQKYTIVKSLGHTTIDRKSSPAGIPRKAES